MAPKKVKKPSLMAKLAQERVRIVQEEEARLQKEAEQEEMLRQEEEERIRLIEMEKMATMEKKKLAKQERILRQKKDGTYLTSTQKQKRKQDREKMIGFVSHHQHVQKQTFPEGKTIIQNENAKVVGQRTPIIAVMGHVDAGKTKLLDRLRKTNVQSQEAGGITQQLGSTFLSAEMLSLRFPGFANYPGIIIIDTPGHEMFINMRKHGMVFADIIILVIDITRGVQPQTIECLQRFKDNSVNFIIALNKIDRLYGWQRVEHKKGYERIIVQEEATHQEFLDRLSKIVLDLNVCGINASLYWDLKDCDYVPMIPISAQNEEGIDELLMNMIDNLPDLEPKQELECFILDHTTLEGYGETLDILLIHGSLDQNERIAIELVNGSARAKIKFLLAPQHNLEMRSKTDYECQKTIRGTMIYKMVLHESVRPLLGGRILRSTEINCEENACNRPVFALDQEGIMIFSSTRNALETIYTHIKQDLHLPIIDGKVGEITKKDVMKIALSNSVYHKIIIAFDIEPEQEIMDLAHKNKIVILYANVIYHLFDLLKNHQHHIFQQNKEQKKNSMVFPCTMELIRENMFNKKNPIVMGVEIKEGSLHLNTPIYIPKNKLHLGRVIGIQIDHKDVQVASRGKRVAIKVQTDQPSLQFGRHFDYDCGEIVSYITRESIDVLKEYYKDEISKDDFALVVRLKKILQIK